MTMPINVGQPPQMAQPQPLIMQEHHINPLTGEDEAAPQIDVQRMARVRDMPVDPNNPETWGKVQRNAPCPCGSGKKFKHCHGALV